MKTLSLEARIENSKKVMSTYPEWVKNNSRFQGGGVVRDHSDMPADDRKKVVKLMKEMD